MQPSMEGDPAISGNDQLSAMTKQLHSSARRWTRLWEVVSRVVTLDLRLNIGKDTYWKGGRSWREKSTRYNKGKDVLIESGRRLNILSLSHYRLQILESTLKSDLVAQSTHPIEAAFFFQVQLIVWNICRPCSMRKLRGCVVVVKSRSLITPMSVPSADSLVQSRCCVAIHG